MTADTLTERFTTRVERGQFDLLPELYTDDALFDAHVPNWRFQVRGSAAIAAQLEGWFQLPGRFREVSDEHTRSDDLLVRFEWREREGTATLVVSREMQLWRLTGALIERMAADAPLVRP